MKKSTTGLKKISFVMNLSGLFLIVLGVSLRHTQAFIFGPISMRCGASSALRHILISSPQSSPRECIYTIRARNSAVCQLRVDFDLGLAPPTIPSADNHALYTDCFDDVLQLGNFRLCGRDVNQHLYINFDRQNGVTSIDISFRLADRTINPNLIAPSWKLQITQLECPRGSQSRTLLDEIQSFSISTRTFINDQFLIAPTGCSQYFTELSGMISSFNYNDGNGAYIGNMNYAICFRRQSPQDRLYLTAIHFGLGMEPGLNLDPLAYVNEICYPQVETVGRSEDYIFIPQGKITQDNIRASYFCGQSLGQKSVHSSNPGPIMMIFNSDTIYHEEAPESGFSFSYNVM